MKQTSESVESQENNTWDVYQKTLVNVASKTNVVIREAKISVLERALTKESSQHHKYTNFRYINF